MRELRVGTRGSALALHQTRWVCQQLRAGNPNLMIREVVIKTHGDVHSADRLVDDWPVGGFVSAIEDELRGGRIDFAVHSYKDLPTDGTTGLVVAAVPPRAVAHDVLVLREPVTLSGIPTGFRIGTSSPRRAAQWRHHARVEIVPVRGNVPTRLRIMERDALDGVVLAGAGLARLRIDPPHAIPLPTDSFLPAPAQGALAVQARGDDGVVKVLATLEHAPSRACAETERALLAAIGPGCHTPVAALARMDGTRLELQGQLFGDETGARCVEASCSLAIDPSDAWLTRQRDNLCSLGRDLGGHLLKQIASTSP